MSDIGLPKGMTRDEAYVAGVADGEKSKRSQLARAQAELNKLTYDLHHGVLVANSGTDTGAGPVSDALRGLSVIQQALDELGGAL